VTSLADADRILAESRLALHNLVTVAAASLRGSTASIPHPVFGAVALPQWVDFLGYHDLRHMNQLEEELASSPL